MNPHLRLMVQALAAQFPGATITLRACPQIGDRYRSRHHEFRVKSLSPLTVVGPSGRPKRITADQLARMERVS